MQVMRMRQMKVLGVDLKDYGLRESMRMVDTFLKGGKVSTIAYITIRGLMVAENSESLKRFLSQVDLTVAADSDILRAAGMENRLRTREIDRDEFIEEFLKKLMRLDKTVYLLTGTKEQMELLKQGLCSYQNALPIVGDFCLEELTKEDDYLVNEINMKMPDVIISNIPSPKREEFYEANHMKLNASVWLMLKDEVVHPNQKKGFSEKIYTFAMSKVFKRKVTQYQSTEKEDEIEK